MKNFIFIFILSLLFIACTDDKEIPIVEDNLSLMAPKEIKWIENYNQKLLKEYDIDYRVITSDEKNDISEFANKKFNQLQENSFSKSGKALLLVVNPSQNSVRLEVSSALEHIYTDMFVSYIQRNQMVPFFRQNSIQIGILASTELMFTRAREASENKEFLSPTKSISYGGGAKTNAHIRKKTTYQKSTKKIVISKKIAPQKVLEKYLEAMRKGNDNPDLDIYSKETKKFFAKWLVTKAQMNNAYKTLKKCKAEEVFINDSDTKAVIRFPIKDRLCSPYYLTKEGNSWKLDFVSMSNTIIMNHNNLWRFKNAEKTKKHIKDYAFAFTDLSFDKNGWPSDLNLKAGKWAIQLYSYKDVDMYPVISAIYMYGRAYEEGLRHFDQILQIDSEKFKKKDPKGFTKVLNHLIKSKTNQVLKFKVLRQGKEVNLELTSP